jgi:hypothetical protein
MSDDITKLALDAAVQNGIVAGTFSSSTMGVKLDLPLLVNKLNEQIAQAQAGDKS